MTLNPDENITAIPDLPPASGLSINDLGILEQTDGTKNVSLSQLITFFEQNIGGDKNFVQSFNNSNQITVQHNLNKRVTVTVVDSAESFIEAAIEYVPSDPLNSVLVSWNGLTSGKIICN